ncbi:amino acid ABC transporter substrate-binding protein [Parasedimentitalea maritima]|uniref:Transporter substrate-binding domain-containing protein n=2 Tax=Parasedimentitalea TaxID=2738399 RepID=A0A6L6WMG2_9RHOB|nr:MULTISPECIES: ABC transporter substrate-binding protein [Zongyanglinia]MVO17785.1 transporter substrate-binding domain-containing protein [Zongyanglinia huanghaiensis]TLP61374.1 amino acid ABC transporter substrate-binding protein [Zongyanglinia marina]
MKFTRRATLAFTSISLMLIGTTFATAQETLNIAAYPANPPWQFKDEAGDFKGFEVDVVTEVASRLDRNVDIKGYDFQALFVAAASGRADMVISSLTITDARLETQSFLQPYVEGAMAVGVRSGSAIGKLDDLAGKNVGSIATSAPEIWLKEREAELGYANYNSYTSVANMLADLRNGRVDAVVNDVVGLRYAFAQTEGLEVAHEIVTGEKFAIMMPKDSPLVEPANAILTEMKNDGTMSTIYEKWFGAKPAANSLTLQPLPVPTSSE